MSPFGIVVFSNQKTSYSDSEIFINDRVLRNYEISLKYIFYTHFFRLSDQFMNNVNWKRADSFNWLNYTLTEWSFWLLGSLINFFNCISSKNMWNLILILYFLLLISFMIFLQYLFNSSLRILTFFKPWI